MLVALIPGTPMLAKDRISSPSLGPSESGVDNSEGEMRQNILNQVLHLHFLWDLPTVLSHRYGFASGNHMLYSACLAIILVMCGKNSLVFVQQVCSFSFFYSCMISAGTTLVLRQFLLH